jgi:hypothetical protein
MHINKFSLITLFVILSISFVNARADDNLVPHPVDHPTGAVDDHGHNGTLISTSVPTSISINSSSNKNSISALSLVFFMI